MAKGKRNRNKNKKKRPILALKFKVSKTVKATPESQYSFSMQKNHGSKEQLIFEKRQDFKTWQKQLFC